MKYNSWKEYCEAEQENAVLDCENGADEDLQVSSAAEEFEFGGKSREKQYYISSFDGTYVRIFVDENFEDVIKQLNDENISTKFLIKIADIGGILSEVADDLLSFCSWYEQPQELIESISDEELYQYWLTDSPTEDFINQMIKRFETTAN